MNERSANASARLAPMPSARSDEGVWTEVKVGNEPLRRFAGDDAQGVQVSVYNVISKTWIAPSESVADLEQGKERAEVHARPGIGERPGRVENRGVITM
jgi:hypothetical protein